MSHRSVRVLVYHRVAEPSEIGFDDPSIVTAPRVFAEQMHHLSRHYRVVGVEEVLEALRGTRALPERAVLLTFDDAYRDFGEVAWPILRRFRFPATLFVPTDYPGHPEREFWWDRLHAAVVQARQDVLVDTVLGPLPLDGTERRRSTLRRLRSHVLTTPHTEAMHLVERICSCLDARPPTRARVLDWSELGRLAREGVALGAHTRSHPALDQLPPERAREEILGSRDDLEREIGSALPIFAYPYGRYDRATLALLEKAGFELGLTCREGHNRIPNPKPLELCRTNVMPRTSPLVFRLRLRRTVARLDRVRQSLAAR